MAFMLATDARLYLPISDEMLNDLLGGDQPFSEALAKLEIPQLACLILIQNLYAKAGISLSFVERMLSDTIALALREGEAAFKTAAVALLDRAKIRAGRDLLPEARILPLHHHEIAVRNYLLPDGSWNPTFCERYRAEIARVLQRVDLPTGDSKTLTFEQSKVFLELKGHTDDHLHVQGYAGTGKSFLIRSLLQLLQDKHAETLVLAEHARQLEALTKGVRMERMYPRTFGEVVREMIPRDLTDPTARRMHRDYSPEPTPDEYLVQHLGIYPIGTFSSHQVVKMVRDTVSRYCSSDDEELGRQHIPSEYIWCDPATRQVVLHHATELWKAILAPQSSDFDPRVRDAHRVKWVALKNWTIPAKYTHIVIDECHNLARPMLQILNRSPQPAFSLGDEYQNLEGKPRRRSVSLRQREVTHSVRSGRGIEALIAPVIRAHPSDIKPDFHGNPMTRTTVTYYDKVYVPDHPTTVLVADMWGLFEWAQRLGRATDFQLLGDIRNLNVFAEDLVELFQHGTRARHRDLFRFTSWHDVTDRNRSRPVIERIDHMLRNGYGMNDWRKTLARFTKPSRTGYALGLIDDVRNREFGSVMLTPDGVDWLRDLGDIGQASSAVYVAVTRAQRQLIIPGRLKNWIEDTPP